MPNDLAQSIQESLAPGLLIGALVYLAFRLILRGFYTVEQSQRAVKTSFGRAKRIDSVTTLDLPIAEALRPDERERYTYPQVAVIQPGGPYFKWPWEQVHKVNIATNTASVAWDPDNPELNEGGTRLEAVTKDHLNTRVSGQLRFRISEQNLYAYIFGVRSPISHVMGYFVAVLRQRIAGFEAPAGKAIEAGAVQGVSINDLRKNLRDLNDRMEQDCASSAARYGIQLDACLITRIDPPDEIESALAAINTAYNHVSSDVSLAQASADQRIELSRRAVEIETLRVQAEVEPLRALAGELATLDSGAPGVLDAYVRNTKLSLVGRANRVLIGGGT